MITRLNPNILVYSGAGDTDTVWGVQSTTIDQDGSAPVANRYRKLVQAYDQDGYFITYLNAAHLTDGRIGYDLSASREVNGTRAYNQIAAYIAADGTKSYEISDKAAFRKAINALGPGSFALGYKSITCTASTGTSAKVPFASIPAMPSADYLAFAQIASNPPYWTELRGPIIKSRDTDGVTVTIWNNHAAAITVLVWVLAIG